MRFVPSCREATAYLNADPPYDDRAKHPFPSLVLLDVGIPLENGFDLLKWVRGQARFAQLRVVVLTGSPEKRAESYALGANSFMVKPLSFTDAAELSRSIVRPRLAA